MPYSGTRSFGVTYTTDDATNTVVKHHLIWILNVDVSYSLKTISNE